MRPKSPEKRGRQKVVRAPAYRIENEYNPEAMPQYFQIAVNVLEERNLAWINSKSANAYIIVSIGKMKQKTSIRRNMETLCDKETFIFDMHLNLCNLLQKNLSICVVEPRCRGSQPIGKISMNLGEIWAEPNHQTLHKWVQLSPKGFLKVDVTIILKSELQVVPVTINDEKLQDDILSVGSEHQYANYTITVYGAFGLLNNDYYEIDKHSEKVPSTFVIVSFGGLSAKVMVQSVTNDYEYCEQISIVDMFPNTNRIINFDVCSNEGHFNRILGSTQLCLQDISHDGENGFLPTFGPFPLHIYASSNTSTTGVVSGEEPFHRGVLLVACTVIVPYYQRRLKTVVVDPVAPIRFDNIWSVEDFCIYCPIFEVSMLDRRTVGEFCGVAITVGEMNLDNKADGEFIQMMNDIRSRKLHYTGSLRVVQSEHEYGYLDFSNAFPVLQFATRLPDFRFKMYRNNMIYQVVNNLEVTLTDVENRLRFYDYSCPAELIDQLVKALEGALAIIVKFLDLLENANATLPRGGDMVMQYNTILDQKQLTLQKEELSLHGWADIVIWLLSGGSRVAFSKISPADIIYSLIPEQCGRDCGRIQTILLKPLKCSKHVNNFSNICHCYAGKVEVLMWMGLYRHKSAFESYLPGFKLKMKDYDMCIKATPMMVECRAFVSKAKLKGDYNGLNTLQTYLRINALNTVKETKVQCKTLAPVWNQVLEIQKTVFMTPERLTNNPAIVLVEVYNTELSGDSELIGRFKVNPAVTENQDFESAPKLQWYDLRKGEDTTGQVLLSVQLIQIPEKVLKNIIYSPIEQSYIATDCRELNCIDNYTPLPRHLLPATTLYKVDVYWWGFRDIEIKRKLGVILEIEELRIKSDIILDKKSNCNFPNGRKSQVFEAPISEVYCPMLNIRLFDSNTFGRMQYLGTNIVKNPNKYVLRWVTKTDREDSLKRASITSSEFVQVKKHLFMKKSSEKYSKNNIVYNSCTSIKSSVFMSKSKYSKWKYLFRLREPDEEEYTLLPLFSTRKDNKLIPSKTNPTSNDWWLKYLKSQKIFDYELENQAEFSKFKDWCATMKLYNRKKTGIPERDKQLYCGLLKVGLAIYRWPSDNKTAVTFDGTDLSKGYFYDHPNNDPAKFLVRVYIVKGINLKIKEFVGKTNPYVLLRCGNKQLGNRNNYLPRKMNPVFGRMYEIRCSLPEDYLLSISLYDYDDNGSDELIGSTKIDLEDRIYSKHRARIGLPFKYSPNDLLKWRDSTKPSTILEELCSKNHLSPPFFVDSSTLVVNGVEYKDNVRGINFTSSLERRENLCLSILHKWYTLPVCGYHLVPEHVETRTLYNADKPGIEQGKLQMWIDIFPFDIGVYIPPPIDITPKETEHYELQVTIYSIRHINVASNSWRRKFSDVYVRAWIGFMDPNQNTDVQYMSCKRDGNFNSRMIFQFQYQPATQEIICQDKPGSPVCSENSPSILYIELMDSEASPPNDCLSSVRFDLNEIPQGGKRFDECLLGVLDSSAKINLFSAKSYRAWWPITTNDRNSDKTLVVSKMDLEMSLVPREPDSLMTDETNRGSTVPLPNQK
ncbi:unnamed protein product [Euphydryas editha]|uniref:C2 domain-containing protein n=1 Tax=Euphydryas editha TaxID=104508 RepID=A0AAU9V058_EUPED|nr:unnamed protein product [Euphydryas editha]